MRVSSVLYTHHATHMHIKFMLNKSRKCFETSREMRAIRRQKLTFVGCFVVVIVCFLYMSESSWRPEVNLHCYSSGADDLVFETGSDWALGLAD